MLYSQPYSPSCCTQHDHILCYVVLSTTISLSCCTQHDHFPVMLYSARPYSLLCCTQHDHILCYVVLSITICRCFRVRSVAARVTRASSGTRRSGAWRTGASCALTAEPTAMATPSVCDGVLASRDSSAWCVLYIYSFKRSNFSIYLYKYNFRNVVENRRYTGRKMNAL